jgi:hypothetical protein
MALAAPEEVEARTRTDFATRISAKAEPAWWEIAQRASRFAADLANFRVFKRLGTRCPSPRLRPDGAALACCRHRLRGSPRRGRHADTARGAAARRRPCPCTRWPSARQTSELYLLVELDNEPARCTASGFVDAHEYWYRAQP